MKLHLLELTGFGPFRERQVVDFDAFDRDGVFLIAGRTGAGKSSILDGVSFALYGSVPRYDGGERRLRSDHCFVGDPTEVRLEFTTAGRRWRVTRAPDYDRPAKRGGGLTTEPQRAELEEFVGGAWIGRAAKPREVGLLLDEVLGLSAAQFQQVILLAQNKFSRFLLATAAERQTLLRTLFGTRRFEGYKDELDLRRREAQKALDTAGEHARTLLDLAERLVDAQALAGEEERPEDLAGRRAAAARALQRAEYRVEARATELSQADDAAVRAGGAHAEAVARAQTLAELERAHARLVALERDEPEIAAARTRLARAIAAEALRAPIENAERAEAALAAAHAAALDATRRWTDAGGAADADLPALLESLVGDLAVWEGAAAQERDLTAAEHELAAHRDALAEIERRRAALIAEQEALPAERAGLEAELGVARDAAVRSDGARDRRDALQDRLAGALEAEELAAVVARTERQYAEATDAAAAGALAVGDLLRRRLAGHAGELAAQLVAGEPCAVCGSTAHPAPASPADDQVGDDDLAAAEQARERAAEAELAAARAARDAREQRAAAVARAGGQDVDTLQAELATALRAVAEGEAAVVERDRLTAALAALDERVTATAAERVTLDALRDAVRRDVATAETRVTALRDTVTAARGAHASVAERIAQGKARRDRARACIAAAEERDAAARVRDDAVRDRDARVAASVFTDADAAVAALLDAETRQAIDARVAAHAADLTGARARLLELEMQTAGLDRETPDLDASAAVVTAADVARTAAIDAHRDARNGADRLRELVVQTDDAYAALGGLADEAAVITRLSDSVAGRAPNTLKMDLETFVLAAELEEIVAAANLRLAEMSAGRYSLHHTDAKASHGRASGLGIEVLDAHTGKLRSAQSLSGGETFLASLALALGLAEVVTNRAGGVRLDTLFVDEGFGSLDPETLELAMRTLDELRAGGRIVGVISHVEAMKEQVPAQLWVEATGDGPSVIRQDVALMS